MKIVSLCPSNTELLIYLGLENHLIGIDDYSDWPLSIQDLPKVGPDLSIDIDKVKRLAPDLVVASLSVPGMEHNIERLKESELKYVVLNPQSLEDIADDMLTIGDKTGTREHALCLREAYLSTLELYRSLSKKVPRLQRLYWEWWPKPVFTPGAVNWLTEMSQLAGGSNVFADIPVASVKSSWKTVIDKNPEHICMVWVGVDFKKVKPGFVTDREGSNMMTAVQNNRIHVLEESLYCRPSPRLILGLKKLSALLHPDIYPIYDEIDPLEIFYNNNTKD